MNVLVVWGRDKDLDLDRPAIGRQVVRDDLPGVEVAVINRRTDPHRADVCCLEHKLPPRLATGDDRRRFNCYEFALLPGRLADLESDIVARKQGAQAGYPAHTDARLDDPERCVLD